MWVQAIIIRLLCYIEHYKLNVTAEDEKVVKLQEELCVMERTNYIKWMKVSVIMIKSINVHRILLLCASPSFVQT